MKVLDGDRWRDRVVRLAKLAPAIVNGQPWRPKLIWKFPRADRVKLAIKQGAPWLRIVAA